MGCSPRTSPGSSGACTTSRPPDCSSSTTPICRSTSRPIGGPRPSGPGRAAARSTLPVSTRRRRPGTEPFPPSLFDAVVVGGEWTRRPYAAALRTQVERVLALGSPRTDAFFDEAAMAAGRAQVLAAHPILAGRRVVLYAQKRRGRGIGKRAAPGSMHAGLRAAQRRTRAQDPPELSNRRAPRPPASMSWPTRRPTSSCTSSSPTIRPRSSNSACSGGRSSCWCRISPKIKRDPGLYLDYRTDMIGTAGGRHRRRHRGDPDRSSPTSWLRRLHRRQLGRPAAARATASWTTSSTRIRPRPGRGDTVPRDVRHE